MSADPTKLPAGPKVYIPEAQPRAEPGASRDIAAQVSELPRDLRDARAERGVRRFEGEIVRTVRDLRSGETVVRVRTERGDIELRLPPEETPPKEGQRVEVELRPAPPPTQQTPQQVQQAVVRPTPAQDSNPPRTTATPVEVTLNPPAPETPAPRPDAAPPPAWPRPGAEVRLQPLSPQEAIQLPPLPSPASLVSAMLARIDLAAQVIITQAQAAMDTALQSPKTFTPPGAQAVIQTPPAIAATMPGAPQPVFAVPPPQIPPVMTQPPRTTAVLPPESVATGFFTPALTIPAQAADTKSTGIPRPQAFDARIDALRPAPALIVEPGKPAGAKAVQVNLPLILLDIKATQGAAVVTGITEKQLPVMSLFSAQPGLAQSFAVHAPPQTLEPPLMPGTQVQITPLPQAGAPASALTQPLPPFISFLAPEPWPAMDEIFRALASLSAPAAQAMARAAPSPANPAAFTPAALFFIAAIRGGDIGGWLGEKTLDILRRDTRGSGLLSRLAQEGGLLSRMTAEPVGQDWRAIPLPLYWQGEFQKIALYFRHDEDGAGQDDKKGSGTRFVFDLSLSNMGKIQVDGLFRPGRLDLILRTEEPLSAAMREDMRATYARALRETSVTGELGFQNHAAQWVTITASEKNFGASA